MPWNNVFHKYGSPLILSRFSAQSFSSASNKYFSDSMFIVITLFACFRVFEK